VLHNGAIVADGSPAQTITDAMLARVCDIDTKVGSPPPAPFVLPSEERLRALGEMVDLGYFRGILGLLDAIEAETPACASFVAHLRQLAHGFQLDAMSGVLRKARDARIVE
jgi:hypothetical protein